jgi:hypothetical protein
LEVLRRLLARAAESSKYLQFFDEYLGASEFELALHILCNFFLEPATPEISEEALNEIRVLHKAMELEDDCVERLQRKLRK